MSGDNDQGSAVTEKHRKAAEGQSARAAVLTVSDTRTLETDRGGEAIVRALEGAGHTVVHREIVPDDPEAIDQTLSSWLEEDDLELILTTGGTGIASRDGTVEVVESHLTRRLEGFGELFRMLSYDQVGPAAMLSRAVGGLAGETLIFALPGSPAAVDLALSELLIPELPHLLWERRR